MHYAVIQYRANYLPLLSLITHYLWQA